VERIAATLSIHDTLGLKILMIAKERHPQNYSTADLTPLRCGSG
jgi:hypothetical protein